MFKKLAKINKVDLSVFIGLLFYYSIFLFAKIDLTTSDIGRHLKNGQLLLQGFSKNFAILNTNFYSYTQTDFPTICHHWLSGIIFYIFYNLTGFLGLHTLFIILSFLAFWLFYRIAKKEVGIFTTLILSLIIIPLIAERTEIRPEVFSYLFSGIFINVLLDYRNNSSNSKWLYVLPFLEIIWVNLHIYFFVGIGLIGIFAIEALIYRKESFKKLFLILILVSLVTLLNPLFVTGSLAPITSIQNYGYRVLENQSIWFLENLKFIQNPNFLLFKITALILILSLLAALITNFKKVSIANVIMTLGFLVAGSLALRNFTIFGLFALILIAQNFNVINTEKFKNNFIYTNRNIIYIFLGFCIFLFILLYCQPKIFFKNSGLGLVEQNNNAAEFFKQNSLSGPIFNNYDIGGYLIFNLFPAQKVFVDNRPEAYSSDFFEKNYIPIQDDILKWKEAEKIYNFNTVFFSHKDATPWGQKFLVNLVTDEDWSVVYVDNFDIIFVKNNQKNQEIINKFKIQKSYFNE